MSELIYFLNFLIALSLKYLYFIASFHCFYSDSFPTLLNLLTELCDAATRIQAAFRGHLARKEAGTDEDLKDDKDLQEITKKVAEELDIDMNDPALHLAATKIQASFRGHKVRKDTTGEPNWIELI